jgi:hypothetical protein
MNLDVDGYICMYMDTGQYISKRTLNVSVDVDLDVHSTFRETEMWMWILVVLYTFLDVN